MAFEPVLESVVDGGKSILSLQKGMQEAAVRPRELEAATSLAESRATVARSQIDMMSKLSQADANAAKAIREANAVGDLKKTEELRMKAYGEANLFEQQDALKKRQLERDIEGSDAVIKASKATEAQNEEMSVSLRSLSDYGPSSDFGETLAKRYKEEVEANPTPENKLKYANTVTTLNKLREYQTTGKPWSQAYKDLIEPAADALSTTAQNHKKNLLEAANERARLKNEADIQRAELKALVDSQKLAADRDRAIQGKQTRINTETMKLDIAYDKMVQKINSEIDKISSEQGEEVDNPDASIWVYGDSKISNPILAAKKEELVALKKRHDENMLGLQEAVDSGKTFVPKPYNKGLTPSPKEVPKEVPVGYTKDAPAKVTSTEEFNKLKTGDYFINPADGKILIKK